MKKKFLALALTAVMALSLAACGGDTQSTDTDADTSGDESASGSQTYTVGIIQQVQHEALDAATQGFQDALTELLGDSVTIDPQNASGDTANCTTIANNAELIGNISLDTGTPIIAGEEGICKGCGVATLTISYYDIGYKTGEMAYDILVNGADPATMPIEYAPQFTPKYNPTMCEALGLTPPDGYEAIAE